MKPALIVIDVQNEYFEPHGKSVLPDGQKALVHIQALLTTFRQLHLPVFHVVHESLSPNALTFRHGSVGAEIHPTIEVLPGEKKITKHFPGSFYQTPLEAQLRFNGIDTIVVCGYMTHLCCDTTTRQASERSFMSLFASDATATRDLVLNGEVVPYQAIQQTTLAAMTQFAKVLTTEEISKKVEDVSAE